MISGNQGWRPQDADQWLQKVSSRGKAESAELGVSFFSLQGLTQKDLRFSSVEGRWWRRNMGGNQHKKSVNRW